MESISAEQIAADQAGAPQSAPGDFSMGLNQDQKDRLATTSPTVQPVGSVSAYILSGFILSIGRGTSCETLENFFLFLYDLGWRFQAVAFEQCTQNVAATVIGDESFSRVVLPDKDFQWQVDRQRWLFQEVGCAVFGISEYHHR